MMLMSALRDLLLDRPIAMIRTRKRGGLTRQQRTTALIVASALMMEQIDSTVLSTALPAMARSFGSDPLHLSVALTSYLVSLSVLIPASGRVADRFGSRTVFCAAIVLFTLGSIACATSQSLGFLVGARLLQGAGGAMMAPVGRLVLIRSVDKSELVTAMVWLLVPATIGPLVGPPLGGFITTALSWRWIFIINVPISVVGFALALRFIPQIRETERQPFDVLGMVLSGTCLAALVFGVELATRGSATLRPTVSVLAIGLLSGAFYLRHARRVVAPILDLTLMRLASFRLSLLSGSATRIVVGATPFLVPSMLQLGFGLTAAQSGLITFTSTVGGLVMRFIARPILRTFGYRTVLSINGLSAAITTLACAVFRPGMPFWALSMVLMAGGFTQALQFTALNTLAYAEVPPERMSAATSFYGTLQQLGMTMGISFAAAAIAVSETVSGHRSAMLSDFSAAFVAVAMVSLLAVPSALRMRADAGAEVSGHKTRL